MPSDTRPRVVLIDDDPRLLQATARLIGTWGYRCQTFIEGRTALIAMAQDPPTVLLVDIYMPDLDGFEVIARMRRIAPGTRIIAISGDIVRGHPTNALAVSEQLGADATIQKPFRPEQLRALLGRWCSAEVEPVA
ncbi:response regulator [uncultured Thiodictyon sp.]|uniref:response regulator n=1 Tax=uncultured Thiodictyon sp. TaxID=1846217 RepID=UPI0025FF71AD|nr:response regulator [uncultured Thiodictyon sp.]